MSRLYYRFAYAVRFRPWEQDAESLAPQLRVLLDREEQERPSSLGRALDLGCGTGRWSLELARRGWDVTGIDLVPKAVAEASERAHADGVRNVRFVEGDVTELRKADLADGFGFLLDVECFNWLSDEQRQAMGREVDAIAAPDATMLLLAWRRAHRGPLPHGATRQDIEGVFDGWRVTNEDAYAGKLPAPLRGIKPCWYRMARS